MLQVIGIPNYRDIPTWRDKDSDGNPYRSKGKGKCVICGGLINEGDTIMLHKNDQTDRWERAHSKCAVSDGANSSYPPESRAPSLSNNSTAADAMSRGMDVSKEVLQKDYDGYTRVVDMDCQLHPDQEFRDVWKMQQSFMEAVSKRMQTIDETLQSIQINLTSSSNRQAAAQEQLVEVLKKIHDEHLKFSQK